MRKLTRRRLAAWVAEESGLSKRQSYEVVGEVLWGIKKALAQGMIVELRNFGVFEVYERKARKLKVPGKGEVQVPRCKDVSFQPGKQMRKLINEG